MKAAIYERQGPASEVLSVQDLPDPKPGEGQVRVRIYASGLNPSDIKTRTGFAGVPMPFPRVTPHQDGAGIIDQVGPGVPAERVGERVWMYEAQTRRATGTAAEYTVIPSENAVPLPENVSFEVGACLGIPALTAHRCLFSDGDLVGRRILVHGGAGAVGTAAILLAKWAGAWVATTVSRPEQEAIVRELGADLVINRHTEDVAALVKKATDDAGVQLIVDVDLTANLATNMACLAPNGTMSAYATDDPKGILPVPFLSAMLRGFVIRFVFVYAMPSAARQLAIKAITACLSAGGYHPKIALRLPLEKIAQAHYAQETGKTLGKIVLNIAGAGVTEH